MEHCGFHRRQWKNITLQMKEKYIFLPEVRLPVASASPGRPFASVKLGHILDDTPPLLDYSAGSGEFIKYKGRSYCWVEISQEGQILLTKKMMDFLKVRPGMELLSIRSSDIAFTMGAKGPLLEKAENYDGEIPLFLSVTI